MVQDPRTPVGLTTQPATRKPLARKMAISGAFSTGKTALVEAIAPRLASSGLRIEVVADVARNAPVPLHNDQTIDSSAWLVGTQIAQESLAMQSGADLVVCDRAVFDVLSHTDLVELRSQADDKMLERIWDLGAGWAETYDLVLTTAIDPSKPVIADGLRVADEAYRERLNKSLSSVLNRLGLPRNDLPTEPAEALEDTLRRVDKLLGGLG